MIEQFDRSGRMCKSPSVCDCFELLLLEHKFKLTLVELGHKHLNTIVIVPKNNCLDLLVLNALWIFDHAYQFGWPPSPPRLFLIMVGPCVHFCYCLNSSVASAASLLWPGTA